VDIFKGRMVGGREDWADPPPSLGEQRGLQAVTTTLVEQRVTGSNLV